jgi:hypothetical protein
VNLSSIRIIIDPDIEIIKKTIGKVVYLTGILDSDLDHLDEEEKELFFARIKKLTALMGFEFVGYL